MNTQLIFRSGLKTIGGTIIELINNDNRLIFDIGVLFDPASNVEVLPNILGVFEGESKYNDFILLSHLHLDHSKAMNLVKNDIPVYMSDKSLEFYNDLVVSGFDQIKGSHDNKHGLKFNQTFNIGGFDITFMPVDHDVIGASAILIENEDISLFYSGDLCIHGRNANYTFDMIKQMHKKDIDVSIFEGVSISFIEDDYKLIPDTKVDEYEYDFANKIKDKLVDDTIIMYNSYIMGIERLKSINELALSLNKKMVIRQESKHLFDKYISKDYLVLYSDIKMSEITTDHILQFSFDDKDKYKELNTQGFLIQTGGSPLGAYDPNWDVLIKFCDENNIIFNPYGLGGHGAPEHIAHIANEISARYLMPLHSFKPELLHVANSTQLMPIKDHVYTFKNHKLIKESGETNSNSKKG